MRVVKWGVRRRGRSRWATLQASGREDPLTSRWATRGSLVVLIAVAAVVHVTAAVIFVVDDELPLVLARLGIDLVRRWVVVIEVAEAELVLLFVELSPALFFLLFL